MTKRRLTLYLVVGIVAGLFVTACAGAATGQIDMLGNQDVVAGGPLVRSISLPSLDIARPAQSAQFNFEKAEVIAPVDQVEVNPLAVQGAAAAQSVLQAEAQTPIYGSAMCARGDH